VVEPPLLSTCRDAMPTDRPAREVIDDHLERPRSGDFDRDARANYHPHVRLFIADGIHRGHDGLRHLADRLTRELPDATFEYTAVFVDGDVGFLEWTATCETAVVRDGADSYVVRDGLIVAQTIHYTVEPRRPSGDRSAAMVAPQGLHNPEAGR
jgi:hypothetical protein